MLKVIRGDNIRPSCNNNCLRPKTTQHPSNDLGVPSIHYNRYKDSILCVTFQRSQGSEDTLSPLFIERYAGIKLPNEGDIISSPTRLVKCDVWTIYRACR